MSNVATLARPYSKAAYEYAVANNVVNEWLQFLTISGDIVSVPHVGETFKNPRIEMKDVLALFLGKEADQKNNTNTMFSNFIHLLWENQRLPALAEIAQQFIALHLQAEKIVEAELTSAQSLSDEEVNTLKHQLEQKWKVKLKLQVSVDESLLGGAFIRMGDRVIDGSVKTQIAMLTKNLETII